MAKAKLGIIAGGGSLPARLVEHCQAEGRELFVIAFPGDTDPETVASVPHAWVRLGAAGESFRLLHDNKVEEVVMAGGIRRPSMASLKPDWRAAKFFARVGLRVLGDDGLLSAVTREIEAEGFRMVGADAILGGLVTPEGPLGQHLPDTQAEADIAHGFRLVRVLGALDVGQAAVVQQGLVLGVEAIEGTDALLQRVAGLAREGVGGVLVKASKPGQERRVDLPTIGPRTVALCQAAGLRGIALEAGHSLILDREQVVAAADRAQLFLVGRPVPAE